MLYDTIILGAGASGLMAAAHLKDHNILLIDGNIKPAMKVRVSGGGRCNITNENVTADNYLGDKELITNVLAEFDQKKVIAYFQDRGLKTVVEKNHQYFCKQTSQDLIDILLQETRHCKMQKNETIMKVQKTNSGFNVSTSKQTYTAKNLIVATGGACYAHIGATDIGLRIAKSFDIQTAPFEPVLVGLSLQKDQFWMKELSGISCKATVSVGNKSFTDQLLFAHKGISGPAVLSTSLYWKKGSITIDFLPDHAIKELFKDRKKQLSSQIPLPKRLTKLLLDALGLVDKPFGSLSSEEKERLLLIKSYTFAPAGNFGLTKAEATRGGVLCEELKLTLESKKIKGLYFIGEVVDVTGELGGYNFQWAFASAVKAAKALRT